ncbi:DUF1697 domain-containing protein [Rubellimicrobium arenae]|uniref:DUF1697 domain-containing protein n=1 Tax=Rubellimicrobium arenae TaxID=2817372 RepID=UPI001B3027A7|nr:DUF1697 domain-containing protein [Rubellimicrobium arenae]
MTAWVILFRGVGGPTQLPTRPLRDALTRAGFGHAVTYINSGNAVATSPAAREEVRDCIADLCRAEFGFGKAVHVVDGFTWLGMITSNPFPEASAAPTTLHLAVLDGVPDPARVGALGALGGPDRIAIRDGAAYLHTPDGFGRSNLGARFDKGIGVPNTARNWNTVLALGNLVRIAADAEGTA